MKPNQNPDQNSDYLSYSIVCLRQKSEIFEKNICKFEKIRIFGYLKLRSRVNNVAEKYQNPKKSETGYPDIRTVEDHCSPLVISQIPNHRIMIVCLIFKNPSLIFEYSYIRKYKNPDF